MFQMLNRRERERDSNRTLKTLLLSSASNHLLYQVLGCTYETDTLLVQFCRYCKMCQLKILKTKEMFGSETYFFIIRD
jgi:hypothetical protein